MPTSCLASSFLYELPDYQGRFIAAFMSPVWCQDHTLPRFYCNCMMQIVCIMQYLPRHHLHDAIGAQLSVQSVTCLITWCNCRRDQQLQRVNRHAAKCAIATPIMQIPPLCWEPLPELRGHHGPANAHAALNTKAEFAWLVRQLHIQLHVAFTRCNCQHDRRTETACLSICLIHQRLNTWDVWN